MGSPTVKAKYTAQLVVMVEESIAEQVKELAAKHEVSRSEVLRTLLKAGLKGGDADNRVVHVVAEREALSEQLVIMVEPDLAKRVDDIADDLRVGKGVIIRSLLDLGFKAGQRGR